MSGRDVYCVTSDVVKCSVTALLCIGDLLLSGEGPYLHLYSTANETHLRQYRIFSSAVIHGINVAQDKIIIFGQKFLSIAVLDLTDNLPVLEVITGESEFPDWIWDVQLLDQPEFHLAVALGHNVIALWNWKTQRQVKLISCEENCILYCAKFIGNCWTNLVLAAGVVFNEVVIWRPHGLEVESDRAVVQGRFKGHEGVIFNIDYNSELQKLSSVSDDRSIRVWSLRTEDICSSQKPVLTLYGHGARVWDAKLLAKAIISIGEDACCIVWSYAGNVLKKFSGHKGQNIWSITVSEERNLIVTGGGDTSIRMWPLDVIDEETRPDCYHSEILDIAEGLNQSTDQLTTSANANEFIPRLVLLLKSQIILIMLQNGTLLSFHLITKDWRCILRNDDFRSYCVMSVSPDDNLLAIGTIHGSIWIYNLDHDTYRTEEHVYESKVLSLCWATNYDIISCGSDGDMRWWKIEDENIPVISTYGYYRLPHSRHRWATSVSLLADDTGLLCGDKRGSIFLYWDEDDISTISSPNKPSDCHICIHGKTGITFICQHEDFVYSTGKDGAYRKYRVDNNRRTLQLVNTFKVYKGFDWLEKLIFTDSNILVTGFHSNDFVVHNATTNETMMKIRCGGGHRSWGFIQIQNKSCFVYIKTKEVIVSSLQKESMYQVMLKPPLHGRVICCVLYLGSLRLTDDDGECAIIATGSEDTTLNINAVISHPEKGTQVIVLHRLQAHISSIRSLALCSALRREGQDDVRPVLLFSAGGRVTINAWRIVLPVQSNQASLQTDVSAEHLAFSGTVDNGARRRHLRKLKATNRESSPETRFMDIKVHKDHDTDMIYIFVAGSDGIIRLFYFNECTTELFELARSLQMECCLLTLQLKELTLSDSNLLLLCSAGTDGKVKLWDMTSIVKPLNSNALATMPCGGLAVTMSSLLGDKPDINEFFNPIKGLPSYIQTATMTGDKQLLLVRAEREKIARMTFGVFIFYSKHQSGVNSLDMLHISGNLLILASGGDDNAINIHLIQIISPYSGNTTFSILDRYCEPSAHAAQITGLRFIDSCSLISCSVDQRLTVWKLHADEENSAAPKLTDHSSTFLCTPDISSLTSWKDRREVQHFAVCGQGLQVLHMDR